MPTRVLTDAELAQLSGYPREVGAQDLTTFFRLDDDARRWVLTSHRGAPNQLGLALALATLPWLGFVPDDLSTAPPGAVGRLADQLNLDPAALTGYGGWGDRTRTEHLREVLARLGWSTASAGALKVLEDFLLARALTRLGAELTTALADLEPILAGSDGPARLGEDGHLILTPLPAEQLPAGAAALRDAAAGLLPHVDLASLLIEVDGWTRFTDTLTHAGGANPRSPELRRNLYAAILAHACNIGVAGMADASGISEDTLAWTTQWYLREDTLTDANTLLVNRHHREPLAALWGGGTLSSSDGQRFPQRGKSLTARALSRYFLDEGTTTYTHVADQHSTYGTKVIPSTVREATYVLDEILGNPTDLPIAEHAVDTHGQTFAAFAAFDLLGLRLSPRIRDLASLQLYRLGPARELAAFPHAGPLLTRPIQTGLITSQWDELLRLAGSLKFGHATALPAHRQTPSRRTAQPVDPGAHRIRPPGAHDLRPALPGRRGAATPGASAAEQRREPARATPQAVLRPRRPHSPSTSHRADRAGTVPDPGHQRRRPVQHRLPPRRPRCPPPSRPRPR